MNKVYCISYASNNFLSRTKSYEKNITNFNKFDDFKIFSEHDLDNNFVSKFKNVLKLPRGGGYWIWKPQIIKQQLSLLNNGDILFYTDIGCSFNSTKESDPMFDYYLDFINQNNFLRFASNYTETEFTNNNTILFFSKKYNQSFCKLAESKHLIASIMAFKKNQKTVNFFIEYMNCLDEDSNIITDEYNKFNQAFEFKDHRHDQSLFSLLYKSLGYNTALKDHTWSSNFKETFNVPILTTRSKN